MSNSKRSRCFGWSFSRLLLPLAALLTSLAAFAPAASGEFAFEPDVFGKAHDPLNQTTPAVFQDFQGVFLPTSAQDAWIQEIADAPEVIGAGAHPDFSTHFRLVPTPGEFPGKLGEGHTKEVVADAPAGAVGNPLAVPRCSAADFHLTVLGSCPPESQVGEAVAEAGIAVLNPVSSLVPYPGVPALLAFKSVVITAILTPSIRSDGDYGLRIAVDDIPVPLIDFMGSTITLWGVPHDPVHDPHRVSDLGFLGGKVEGTPEPFLSAPTNCESGPIPFTLKARTWEAPDHWIEHTSIAPAPTGCELLEFEPELVARPSTDIADSPSGLEVDLKVPQNEGCVDIEPNPPANQPQYECDRATSHLKDATVTLPEGLAVNPASANGLDGCSPSEVGLTSDLGETPVSFTAEPANCPDASKLAEVEVDTPLLDQPLKGTVNIADPHDNPFKSLLAIYINVDDKQTGIVAKLAGHVQADPQTGQLTTTFADSPQLPFEHFRISFKQGPHAPLRTPALCGSYETTSELVPYSAPETSKSPSDEWQITQSPGGSCPTTDAERPNAPAFDAGTVTPVAGAESPFVMHLRREDGSQNFAAVTLNPPPGLLAKLAGTEICSEAAIAAAAAKSGQGEKASPSCPANSRLGSVVAGAGAGPSPYYAPGTAYLAGPYKGAPLSLAIIAPATAGPFDLGTVVNRVAAHIDPRTAQITAVSDPLPTILEGIPLDIRTVDVHLDRPSFTRNPTSCDPFAVKGLLTSTLGQTAALESRFQVAECGQLGFKPKISLRLFGKRLKRGDNPQLRAAITPRPGDANISRVSVQMPRSLFLDQSHIRTICTRVQFAADACPPGSIYGSILAQSPLVDYPLTGNVYLRSSDNKLPDLVADLRGPAHQPVRIEGVGRTDAVKGALRNTFDIVPDAPVSKIVLTLQPGKKSLLVASRDLCEGAQRAKVELSAHNGRQLRLRQKIKIPGCGGESRKGKRERRR